TSGRASCSASAVRMGRCWRCQRFTPAPRALTSHSSACASRALSPRQADPHVRVAQPAPRPGPDCTTAMQRTKHPRLLTLAAICAALSVTTCKDVNVTTVDPARIEITPARSEEHTSELQSRENLVCRLL